MNTGTRLTEAEHEDLSNALSSDGCHGFGTSDHPEWVPAVERILDARLADLRAENERLRDMYAEREQRWHWSLIKEQDAKKRAMQAEAERDAALAVVERVRAKRDELADLWIHRQLHCSHIDVLNQIHEALDA